MTFDHIAIKAGSRGSPLALTQIDEIAELLNLASHPVDIETVVYATRGDKDKVTSLTANVGDDFFTNTLDQAVLDGQVDVAIHSAKDLPQVMREGLCIYALTSSADDTDCFVGRVSFKSLKKGAKIGTSSRDRRQQVCALNPFLEPVDIRGTIEERLALVDSGVCDGVIVASIALKRLGLAERITDVMPWEGTPLQGQLAVVGRQDNPAMRELFSVIDTRRRYGRIWLVGAGPGDPGLLTISGKNALEQADCVLYDYLVHKDLLDYAPTAEQINVGKRKGVHTLPQDQLSRLIKQKAYEGKNVVRLKGGDPFIFGRGADELTYLRSYHIKVEVIPGVSSAIGVPSALQVPLTARGVSDSVAFLSGHGGGETSAKDDLIAVPKVGTVVFLMGLTKLNVIVRSMAALEWDSKTPVMVVAHGTCIDQKVVRGTLTDIEGLVKAASIQQPALIIVGQTIDFWSKSSSRTILYTGTNPEMYRSLGRLIHHPMIAIKEEANLSERAPAVCRSLDSYDMILLTSRFAVKYFMDMLRAQSYPLAQLSEKLFLVIGKTTREALSRYGLNASIVAREETSHGLLDAVTRQTDVCGKKILFPRSALSNPTLKDRLSGLGAQVDEFVVYDNVKPKKQNLPNEPIDAVFFTSPSTVKNFCADYGDIPAEWSILCKGPVTQKALNDAGYTKTTVIADAHKRI